MVSARPSISLRTLIGYSIACLLASILVSKIGNGAGAEKTIIVAGIPFQVELAQTVQERRQGLMFRRHLPTNHGMLFIQPKTGPVAFWMKNTYIPLDLLYFDDQGRLQTIHADVPPCTATPCPLYTSDKPIKYILEINGGSAERLGLKTGDYLELD